MRNFLKVIFVVVILLILFLAFISCSKTTCKKSPGDKVKISGTKIEVEWIKDNVNHGFNKVTIDDTIHLIVLRATILDGV